VNFALGKIPSGGKSPRKCIYSVAAQETAKHRAQFGWPPVSDVAAVTKPRRQTQAPARISAVSGPTFAILSREDMRRRYCCLTTFFHALVAKIQPDKVVRWCQDVEFLAIFTSCIFREPRAAHFTPAF